MGAAIERLKALATQSGSALLSEGPVHPDHALLALCAEAHDLRAAELDAWRRGGELRTGQLPTRHTQR
jgi:hypothetical protein